MTLGRPLLALLAAVLVATVLFSTWIGAQARAALVLVAVVDAPVVSWSVRAITSEPELRELSLAGVPTTVALPSGDGPWPAVVFLNGATELGRFHPQVRSVAEALARAGFLVAVPDPPGLRRGEITERTLAASIAVADAVAGREDVRRRRVALFGVSVGTSLGLLVAQSGELDGRVSVVAGTAPYADLVDALRVATTGTHRVDGRLVRYEAEPFVTLALARSLAASLPPGPSRARLTRALAGVETDDPDPLQALPPADAPVLGAGARAVVRLLENRDPRRFDALYARLPYGLRRTAERLSPIEGAERLRVPVELASAPNDKYFPPAESRELVAAAPDARLTITGILEHAVPEPSLGGLRALLRFDAFLVRALREAREA